MNPVLTVVGRRVRAVRWRSVAVNAAVVGGSACLIGLACVPSAFAALPAAATSAITGIQTDGQALLGDVWPVAGAIVGGSILLKLFKKFTSKAT